MGASEEGKFASVPVPDPGATSGPKKLGRPSEEIPNFSVPFILAEKGDVDAAAFRVRVPTEERVSRSVPLYAARIRFTAQPVSVVTLGSISKMCSVVLVLLPPAERLGAKRRTLKARVLVLFLSRL